MKEQQKAPKKTELNQLIKQAAAGSDEAARRLVSPFVHPDEKLLHYGISASFGLIKTYDFLFLTDRRIGDLEVTALTGNLNVEVAFLQKIDAFVLSQPSFPLLLRLTMLFFYPLFAVSGFFVIQSFAYEAGWSNAMSITLGVLVAVLAALLVRFAINPNIMRAFLRFKKSGLWCKLQGNPVGILIFADRNKFAMLTEVTRLVSDVKRQLDKIAM
jgi:hypothetical protein